MLSLHLGFVTIFGANTLVLSLRRTSTRYTKFKIKIRNFKDSRSDSSMTRQTRQRTERSQQAGSQEASSDAGEGQASIYITRDEMEAMNNLMQERMMKSQQEMLQNFFEQMRAAGTQNLGPATAAVNVEQGARAMEPNGGHNAEPGGNQQGLGGRPAGSNAEVPLEGAQPARANTNANEPPEEYVPEFSTRLGGQDRDMTRGNP